MIDGNARVLVVDDEIAIRDSMAKVLNRHGYESTAAPDSESAIALMDSDPFDVVVTDIRMPGMSGIDLMRHIKQHTPDTIVLLMTAHASLDTAIDAVREGASDYLVKPVRFDSLAMKIRALLRMRDLEWENRILRIEKQDPSCFENIVGVSRSILDIKDLVLRAANVPGNVLIEGESGTGKELVARAIHEAAPNRRGAFVPVNCGSIPETLLESEFFGHVKGAFTGADRDKEGLFQEARFGTLFLDEIGELPLSLQPKILRAIETKEIRPVGSTRSLPIDLRIVAATNRNLEEMVSAGGFREDLYFRLNVLRIGVPPLRERVDDIAPLAHHFLETLSGEFRSPVRAISPEAIATLESYPWKGNARELYNIVQRALITATRPVIDASLVERLLGIRSNRDQNLKRALRDFEKHHIRRILDSTAGDKHAAAKALGISLASLYAKLKD